MFRKAYNTRLNQLRNEIRETLFNVSPLTYFHFTPKDIYDYLIEPYVFEQSHCQIEPGLPDPYSFLINDMNEKSLLKPYMLNNDLDAITGPPNHQPVFYYRGSALPDLLPNILYVFNEIKMAAYLGKKDFLKMLLQIIKLNPACLSDFFLTSDYVQSFEKPTWLEEAFELAAYAGNNGCLKYLLNIYDYLFDTQHHCHITNSLDQFNHYVCSAAKATIWQDRVDTLLMILDYVAAPMREKPISVGTFIQIVSQPLELAIQMNRPQTKLALLTAIDCYYQSNEKMINQCSANIRDFFIANINNQQFLHSSASQLGIPAPASHDSATVSTVTPPIIAAATTTPTAAITIPAESTPPCPSPRTQRFTRLRYLPFFHRRRDLSEDKAPPPSPKH